MVSAFYFNGTKCLQNSLLFLSPIAVYVVQGELLSPCRCDGSVRCTHQPCLIRWISERGSWSCELCYFKYQVLAISTKNPLQVNCVCVCVFMSRTSCLVFSLSPIPLSLSSGRPFLWQLLRRCRLLPSSWGLCSSLPVFPGLFGPPWAPQPSGSAKTCSSRSAMACTASWTLCA